MSAPFAFDAGSFGDVFDIATLVAPLTLRSATPVRLHHQLPPPRRRMITTHSAAASRGSTGPSTIPIACAPFPRFSSISGFKVSRTAPRHLALSRSRDPTGTSAPAIVSVTHLGPRPKRACN